MKLLWLNLIKSNKKNAAILSLGSIISVATGIISIKYQDLFYLVVALIIFAITLVMTINAEATSLRTGSVSAFLDKFRHLLRKLHVPKNERCKFSLELKVPNPIKLILLGAFLAQAFFFSISMFFFAPALGNGNQLFIYGSALIQSSKWLMAQKHFLFWAVALVWAFAVIVTVSKIWPPVKVNRKTKALGVFFGITYLASSILISSSLSFLLILGIAKIEVINTSRLLNTGESLRAHGIYTNVDDVKEHLTQKNTFPAVISGEVESSKPILSAIIQSKKNRSEFYKRNIMDIVLTKSAPKLELKNDVYYLPSHVLVVTRINKDIFQGITPFLTKKVVEQHFDPLHIKQEPKMEILSKPDYIIYRDKQIDEQVSELDGYINEVKKTINAYYGYISEDKNKIAVNQNGLKESATQRDSNYSYCIGQVNRKNCYTYYGYTYCYPSSYTEGYCDQQRAQWDSVIQGFQKNVNDWEAELKVDQRKLAEFQEMYKLLNSYRELVEGQKDTVLYELGIFEPEDSIKVVLENASVKSLADFFSTSTHEYLHYTSYISSERTLPRFFEEGLTEYFSRKAITKPLHESAELGYPVVVKVIEKMVKDIGEDQLIKIYFDKDASRLISLLNEKYGKDFYEDSKYYFSVIPFLSFEDSIKLANNILFIIGGAELKESDFR